MKEAFAYLFLAAVIALIHMDISGHYSLPNYILLTSVWTVPLQSILIVRNIVHNRRVKLENRPTPEPPPPQSWAEQIQRDASFITEENPYLDRK